MPFENEMRNPILKDLPKSDSISSDDINFSFDVPCENRIVPLEPKKISRSNTQRGSPKRKKKFIPRRKEKKGVTKLEAKKKKKVSFKIDLVEYVAVKSWKKYNTNTSRKGSAFEEKIKCKCAIF